MTAQEIAKAAFDNKEYAILVTNIKKAIEDAVEEAKKQYDKHTLVMLHEECVKARREEREESAKLADEHPRYCINATGRYSCVCYWNIAAAIRSHK